MVMIMLVLFSLDQNSPGKFWKVLRHTEAPDAGFSRRGDKVKTSLICQRRTVSHKEKTAIQMKQAVQV